MTAAEHEYAAAELEARPFSPALVPRIAEHLSAAGIVDRAMCYFEAAGDIDTSAGEYDAAARSYRRVLSLEEQRGVARPALVRKLARALSLCGEHAESAMLLSRLVGHGDSVHEHPGDVSSLGMAFWGDAQSASEFEGCMRALEATSDDAVRFECLTTIASLSCELGDPERAKGFLDRANDLAAKVPSWVRARFFDVSGRVKMASGLIDAALDDFSEAHRLAEIDADDDLYFAINGNYADNLALIGSFDEALRIWRHLYLRAESSHIGWHVPDAAFNAASCLIALGNLREAVPFVERAFASDTSCLTVRIHAAATAVPLGILLDRPDFIERCATDIVGVVLRSREAARIGPTVAAFAELHLARNGRHEAAALLEAGVAALRSADHAFAMLALAAEHAGSDAAAAALTMLEAAAARRRDPLSIAFRSLAQAVMARRDRNLDRTRRCAAEASRGFAALGLPLWQARALEVGGRMRKALDVYQTMGDVRDARRLCELFARRKSRTAVDAQLTDRQREIARLVAQGCSNKTIGVTLSIKEKTVENHLRVIYGRLGLPSRAKLIARFASGDPL